MDNYRNKLRVFISSKIGSNKNDQKYMLARTAAKKALEMTGLFTVYSFEATGPSTGSAIDNWLLCQESGHKSTNKFDFQFKLLNLIFGGRSFSPVQILKTL